MNTKEIVSTVVLVLLAIVLVVVLVALYRDCSSLIRERKEKKKQNQNDTVPPVDRDLEKSMPPALEEGQERPEYPQPAVVNQCPDALSTGPWLPVYLEGRHLHGFEGRFVYH